MINLKKYGVLTPALYPQFYKQLITILLLSDLILLVGQLEGHLICKIRAAVIPRVLLWGLESCTVMES